MAPFLSPGYLKKTPEDHPKKTYRKKGIKPQQTPKKLTIETPLEKNAPKDDHKTVLKAKSKNIKTAAKQRITRKKTLNKLTSKTPLEPVSSSTVKKSVRSESSSELDKFWDDFVSEPSASSFMLKPLQLPPDYDFHDHNVCVAEELGFDYGVPIPGCFAKYFDEEAMVPVIVKPSRPSDSDSVTFDPFSWSPFDFESSSDVDSPSPPADGDVMGVESNDAPIDLGGPMTRSKTKKAMEERFRQIEEDSKWSDSSELLELIE